jgi:transcriptional regulator with XRE-family HTH domain
MRQSMDKQVAAFLRKERGELTFAQFSRKTGLPASTLFRLENCQQSITLMKLEGVLNRLKKAPHEVFCRD